MTSKNLVSLVCFLLILVCWVSFFYVRSIEVTSVIAAPLLAVTGFIVSIGSIRSKQQRALSWILFSLHTLTILVYLSGIIYMTFFWHPRFF